MKKGRPTIYSDGLLAQARKYLTDFKKQDEVIPTIEGLALYLDVRRSTIYDWQKQEEKKEFSYILEELMETQAKILANKGLTGVFNAPITKMMLSKHGYVEKTETDITTKGEKITTENQAQANEAIAKYLSSINTPNQRPNKDTPAVSVQD